MSLASPRCSPTDLGASFAQGKLIVEEARNTGGIENAVYSRYSKAGYGALMLPMIIGLSCAMQGAQAIGSYWIVWWQVRDPSGIIYHWTFDVLTDSSW